MESKYLTQFNNNPHKLPLRGNRVLVEPLPKEEIKTASGIIVAAPKTDHRSTLEQNRAELAVVLAVGSGYYDEEGSDVPVDLAPGNVVLINGFGLRAYSDFPGIADYVQDAIAMIRDNDVHAAWESLEAYKAYRDGMSKC